MALSSTADKVPSFSRSETVREVTTIVDEFINEVDTSHSDFTDALRVINTEFRKMDKTLSLQKRQKKRYNDLELVLDGLEAEALTKEKRLEVAEMRERMQKSEAQLQELGRAKRKTGSVLLRLIMGRVSVLIYNEADKQKFKNEYNDFKARMKWPFLLLPLAQYLLGVSLLQLELYSLVLVFYYTVAAVRENILAINGSRIDPWWIYHHYISCVGSVLYLLAIGNGENHLLVTSGCASAINLVMIYQGVVMFLQQEYQSQRNYTRLALKKKGAYDVKTSEVVDERPTGIFSVLIPALYIMYLTQFSVGVFISWIATKVAADTENYAWIQSYLVWGVALTWFALCIGNVATLMQVLYRKKVVSGNRMSRALAKSARVIRQIIS